MANRLKELRLLRGWTQEDAARRVGVSTSGYQKIEQGTRKLSEKTIGRFAEAFGVLPNELFSDNRDVPIMGYIGAGDEILPEFEQVPPEGIDQITLPVAVEDKLIAFRVRGPSMLPRYEEGDLVVVRREQKRGTDWFIGKEAAVRTVDGRRFLKRLMVGENGYKLVSWHWNVPDIEPVEIAWVGEIVLRIPAYQFSEFSNEENRNRRVRKPRDDDNSDGDDR